jgi:hypothetical protein
MPLFAPVTTTVLPENRDILLSPQWLEVQGLFALQELVRGELVGDEHVD